MTITSWCSTTSHHLLLRGGAFALLLSLSAGCISHRATVTQEELAPDQEILVVAIAGDSRSSWPGSATRHGPHPQELPATLWLRDGEGRLLRADARVETPRPWWQRFPADIVTDLLPWTFTIEQRQELRAQAIPELDGHELDAAARAFGYASGDEP